MVDAGGLGENMGVVENMKLALSLFVFAVLANVLSFPPSGGSGVVQ